MATVLKENVDYRLLNRLSDLVICSHCLRSGKVTPVPQLIGKDRAISNICPSCRLEKEPESLRRPPAQLLQFPQR